MISLDEVRRRLPIDRNRIDDELEIHSDVAFQLSQRVAQLDAEAARAADSLKRIEAGLLLDFRAGDGKPVLDEIKARVLRDNRRLSAFDLATDTDEQLAIWKGLLEAWKNKGFGLRALADLYHDNYFAAGSSSIGARKDRDEGRDEARELIRRSTKAAQAEREEPRRQRRRLAE